MRRLAHTAAPWLPWAALAVRETLEHADIVGDLSLSVDMLLVGFAICITTSTLVCRRLSALAGQAPVSEALSRGYQLASEHCVMHVGRDAGHQPLPMAVGESTTGAIPTLHVVPAQGRVYGTAAATGIGVHRPAAATPLHRQQRRAPRP